MARTWLASLLVAMIASPLSLAQIPIPIVKEGDPITAVGAGQAITGLSTVSVNGVGGYGLTVTSTDGVTTRSSVIGSALPGAPVVLQTEAVIGMYDQTSFEGFHGISNSGTPCYSPSVTDTSTGTTGLDAVFFGNMLLGIEDDPIPALPGKLWRFNSRPGVSPNGVPYWIGGIDDATTSANEGNGLFLAGQPLLKTGDSIPGAPGVIDSGIDFDYRFSADTLNYITPVDILTGSSSNDAFLVLNGSLIPTSQGVIAEAQPVTAANGGLPGENWTNFDYFGINNSGEYFWTGNTSASTTSDEYVARDTKIIYREGDVLDGAPLSGAIEAAYMNELGDIAFIWDINDPFVGNVEALYLNGKLLVKETDAVDFDGDGIIDPFATISGLTGDVAIGEDRVIYFTADIDTLGTTSTTDDTNVLFSLLDPCGSVKAYNAGCAGSGGFVPQLQLRGCSSVGGSVTLEITRGLGGSTAIVLFGLNRTQAAIGGGCVLSVSPVFPSVITLPLGGTLPGEGTIAIPAIIPPTVPPTMFTMQAFVVDPSTPIGGVGTNGLEVTINP